SLPPAAVIRTVKAGLSRALPGLSPTPALNAVHRPRRFGEGKRLGGAGRPPAATDPGAAPELCPAAFGEPWPPAASAVPVTLPVARPLTWWCVVPAPGRWPLPAANAAPPPTAARTIAIFAVASFASAVFSIGLLLDLGVDARRAARNAVTAASSPASSSRPGGDVAASSRLASRS